MLLVWVMATMLLGACRQLDWERSTTTTSSARLQSAAVGESRKTPDLASYSAFEFRAEAGTMEVYDRTGGLKQRSSDRMSDPVHLVVTGPETGLMVGNVGTADAKVSRTASSLQFIEGSAGGSFLRVLTIENRWRSDVGGFSASWVRNLEASEFSDSRLVTTFTGYAKPSNAMEAGKGRR